jgi:hypothetical protein
MRLPSFGLMASIMRFLPNNPATLMDGGGEGNPAPPALPQIRESRLRRGRFSLANDS